MIVKLYNYLTMLGSREKGIPCSEGDCINDDSKSSHRVSHVESEDVPKDISEPVISFLKCFEENPRRFKLILGNSFGCILKDIEVGIVYEGEYCFTTESFEYHETTYHKELCCDVNSSLGLLVLTEEEVDLVYLTLKDYYQQREQRYKEILAKRKERAKMNTRKRLTEVYKE